MLMNYYMHAYVEFEGEKNHKKGEGGVGWIVFLETSSFTF